MKNSNLIKDYLDGVTVLESDLIAACRVFVKRHVSEVKRQHTRNTITWALRKVAKGEYQPRGKHGREA